MSASWPGSVVDRTGRAYYMERRWPRRGERAPRCGYQPCQLRARYVYHVGVVPSQSYCERHACDLMTAVALHHGQRGEGA